MALEGVVDSVVRLVGVVGLPLLVVLFFGDGLIVGKVVQPPAVFVAVVAIARPSRASLLVVCVACTIAVVVGQWTVYRRFDGEGSTPPGLGLLGRSLEGLQAPILRRVGGRPFVWTETFFQRYGALAIFVTTYLPVVRCTLAVPAGFSSYPERRFLAVTALANSLYVILLVGVAYGLISVLGLG